MRIGRYLRIMTIAIQGCAFSLLNAQISLAQCELGADAVNSYYVPQAGSLSSPLEGSAATAFFRMCPNNDGGASLPNNARIKIVVRDINNNPIANYPASSIIMMFNGGTAAQGFSGSGADSIIANGTWNVTSASANGTYTLRIKNFDFLGGLSTQQNVGERVGGDDFNNLSNHIGVSDALSYWRDFNSDGVVTSIDFNMLNDHLLHDCAKPSNP